MKRLALSLIVLVLLSGCEVIYFAAIAEKEQAWCKDKQFLCQTIDNYRSGNNG